MSGVQDTDCVVIFYFVECVFMYTCRPVCVFFMFIAAIKVLLLLFVGNLYSARRIFQHQNVLYVTYCY